MKLDDIKDNISNLVASNIDLNGSKYIRTEMEEITGYGNIREMESFLKNHKKELNLTENAARIFFIAFAYLQFVARRW